MGRIPIPAWAIKSLAEPPMSSIATISIRGKVCAELCSALSSGSVEVELGRQAAEATFLSPLPRTEDYMKRVTGIGGIFFKAKDPQSLWAWYKRHLGIDVQVWGGAAFPWTDAEGKPVAGTTAWSIVQQESGQFAPSLAPFMVNYRVDDLHALVKALKEEGCNVLDKIDESEYGKFAWVMDPEGNKVELWQPLQGE
jgi:predicted enzyme related to lactoylglutathione lyase